MIVLLDSAVLIDHLRGSAAALHFMESLAEVPSCSEVSRVEVIRALRSHERRRASALLATLRWAPVDEATARRAGELGRHWRQSHPGIGTVDLIIAATAELLGAELATTNVRHFPMFGGLRPPYRS